METTVRNKENKLYDYFDKYLESIDPAGLYENHYGDDYIESSEQDEDPSGKSPFEVFTFDNMRFSWDENGLALVVEERGSTEPLKDFYHKNKERLQTTFLKSLVEFNSSTGAGPENSKLIIGIDVRPKSAILDLPINKSKELMEKLADAVMAYHHICLTQ